MLFAHLIHNSAFNTAAEGLSLVKGAHQSKLSCFLQVCNMMRLVITLQELVEEPESILLLHRTNLNAIRKVVHRWLHISLAPDLCLEHLHVKGTFSIPDIGLDDVVVELFQMVQVIRLDTFLTHDETFDLYELTVSLIHTTEKLKHVLSVERFPRRQEVSN